MYTPIFIFPNLIKWFSSSEAGLPYVRKDEYTIKKANRLGGGFFGAVYRGHYGVPVAVKVIKTTHSVSVFKSEINIAG